MQVLITGGSSLMGAALARTLVRRGDRVRTFQRRSNRGPVGLGIELGRHTEGAARSAEIDPSTEVDEVLGDVRDREAIAMAAVGCDAIVHLAAKVGVVGARRDFVAVNVDGTDNVLAAARSAGVSRVVHVSSPSVAHTGRALVGAPAGPPVTDHPGAWYPETKAIAEQRALGESDDELGVVAIRPHLVWGPGDSQLVGRIVERARDGRLALVGGGRALVDTTCVDNAVSALVSALDAVAPGRPCAGRAYVVANGEPRPIRELVEGICSAAGVPFRARSVPLDIARPLGWLIETWWERTRRDGDPPLTRFLAEQLGTAHWFDPRPAREDLGWAPEVTIDEGLERLRRWFVVSGQ